MANQQFNLAGGRPDPTSPMEILTRPELGAGSATPEMPKPRRMTANPIQFFPTTGGLRKSFRQSIALDDPQQSEPASCPSEVFLG